MEEKAAVEQCQNNWMPDAFVISVMVGTSAACLWSSYWFRKKRFRHGSERAEGENDSPSGQDVRGPDITDIGRRQTSLSNRGSGFAARKSAREIKDHHATGNESDRNQLQHIESEEDAGQNGNEGAAKDEHRVDNEERHRTRNESESRKIQTTETEEDTVDNTIERPAEDAQGADKEGTCEITGKMATAHDTEINYQPGSVNESDRNKLKNTEKEEETVDKEKRRSAEDMHGAVNQHEVEVRQMLSQFLATGAREEKPGTLENGRKICDIKGRASTGNESDRNKLQNRETENAVNDAKKGLAKIEHYAESEELILQYRYYLRVQSRNMRMPKLRLISDIYTNPRITVTHTEYEDATGGSHNHVREVEVHELLKRSNSDSDKTTISVVYGAAGMGKTTIVQKIIHDWATGMKYEHFRFVLHFKIQNLNAIEGRITLSRLIVDAYPFLKMYLDHLWREPKRLLFIFDDLNKLHRSFIFTDDERNSDPRHRCTGPESNCLVNDILRCLLKGELLKGCSVLLTARLWKQEMLRHVTVDSTFQVMGFTSEKVEEYLCRYPLQVQNAKAILQFIEQNDILRNMSSSPLFCLSLASSLDSHRSQREDQTTIPIINHTQLLFDYVALLLGACGYDDNTTQKSLIEVGKLAYKGIERNTLLLSLEADALSNLNACPPNFISAFMIQDADKQRSGVVYGFRHFAARDFLAAFANILNTPIAGLTGLLDQTFMDPGGRFRTFLLFLFGLSSKNSVDRLKLELGSDHSEVTSCISEWLTKSVNRRLTNMDGTYMQRTFLHTLYCLHEFGDDQVMMEVLAPITTIKLNQLLLTSPDCAVLGRTLFYSEVIEELDVSSCLAQPEEMKHLEHLLHKCIILRLNQNNLQDSGVKTLFNILKENDCKIQTLELRSNRLTDDCLPTLFSALSANHSVTQLNLSNSSQDEKQANQFTHGRLKHHVENYAQKKKISWLRQEPIGQDTASNILILKTD